MNHNVMQFAIGEVQRVLFVITVLLILKKPVTPARKDGIDLDESQIKLFALDFYCCLFLLKLII